MLTFFRRATRYPFIRIIWKIYKSVTGLNQDLWKITLIWKMFYVIYKMAQFLALHPLYLLTL